MHSCSPNIISTVLANARSVSFMTIQSQTGRQRPSMALSLVDLTWWHGRSNKGWIEESWCVIVQRSVPNERNCIFREGWRSFAENVVDRGLDFKGVKALVDWPFNCCRSANEKEEIAIERTKGVKRKGWRHERIFVIFFFHHSAHSNSYYDREEDVRPISSVADIGDNITS